MVQINTLVSLDVALVYLGQDMHNDQNRLKIPCLLLVLLLVA